LAAAADASGSGGISMNNAFDQFMQSQSPAAVSSGNGKGGDADAEMQLMMSIPGTLAAEKEDLNNVI
ncbi:TPA: S49 family peptidase, partial [Salmonella enterica subsp. enterica serovar Enteritidis]|nr:S49 family peptidase [Salmonella enterica]